MFYNYPFPFFHYFHIPFLHYFHIPFLQFDRIVKSKFCVYKNLDSTISIFSSRVNDRTCSFFRKMNGIADNTRIIKPHWLKIPDIERYIYSIYREYRLLMIMTTLSWYRWLFRCSWIASWLREWINAIAKLIWPRFILCPSRIRLHSFLDIFLIEGIRKLKIEGLKRYFSRHEAKFNKMLENLNN